MYLQPNKDGLKSVHTVFICIPITFKLLMRLCGDRFESAQTLIAGIKVHEILTGNVALANLEIRESPKTRIITLERSRLHTTAPTLNLHRKNDKTN